MRRDRRGGGFVRLLALTVMLLAFSGPLALFAQAPAGQGEFVPVSQLPPSEQLPAAPLLIAAYAFVWIATAAYLWIVWRRLGRVEREMRDLERRQGQRSPR
jgi:CcmD family protein